MIAENKPQDDGCGDPTELLTAGDLARWLKVSLRQIHRMNRSALIPRPLKIGGCTRWREREIFEWMKAGAPVRDKWEQGQAAQTVGDENT